MNTEAVKARPVIRCPDGPRDPQKPRQAPSEPQRLTKRAPKNSFVARWAGQVRPASDRSRRSEG
eukprot:1675488-Pyramimonas_sp.AAC.1